MQLLIDRMKRPVSFPTEANLPHASTGPFIVAELMALQRAAAHPPDELFGDGAHAPTSRSSTLFWMGLCKLPPRLQQPPQRIPTPETLAGSGVVSSPARRLDLRCVPWSERAFALLFLTGSAMFNRSMRHRARDLGMTLSDHGLRPARRQQRQRLWVGPSLGAENEQEIFQALGLKFIPPQHRDGYRTWTTDDLMQQKQAN